MHRALRDYYNFMRNKFLLACSVMTLVSLTISCSPTNMAIGAGAEVGSALMEVSSYDVILDDVAIGTQIKGNLFNFSTSLFVDVKVTVKEGVVFLTGSVPSPDLRIEAVRIAWQASGVSGVRNEIQVSDRSSLLDSARDKWISTKLLLKLTFDKQVRSVNYSIDTDNKNLYLMGIARSSDELKRVFAYARSIPYVRKIISHVRLSEERHN